MKSRYYTCAGIAGLAAGLLLLGGGASVVPRAGADPTFTNASLKGNFGFTAGGGSMVSFGLMTADGAGGVTGVETAKIAGVGVVSRQFNGSYSVNADGTGSLEINYLGVPVATDEDDGEEEEAGSFTAKYSFVLVDGNKELRAVRTDTGEVMTAAFRLQ